MKVLAIVMISAMVRILNDDESVGCGKNVVCGKNIGSNENTVVVMTLAV